MLGGRYERGHDFVSQVSGARLNEEFAAIGGALGEQADSLNLIQRDDGELRDRVVKRHTMHPEVSAWIASLAQDAAANPEVLADLVRRGIEAKLLELGVLADLLNGGSAIDFLSFKIVNDELVAHYTGVLGAGAITINDDGFIEVAL